MLSRFSNENLDYNFDSQPMLKLSKFWQTVLKKITTDIIKLAELGSYITFSNKTRQAFLQALLPIYDIFQVRDRAWFVRLYGR